MRADGRTPFEVLRNNSYQGGLACFGEVVWARVPGTRLLRGKYEVNWLELVWLGARRKNTEEHLCGDEHGVRKFRTIRQQPESARWRRVLVDRLTGEPFNPKPKSGTRVANYQLTCNGASEDSPNVNVDEAPKDEVPEPAVTQKRWYVTEALVNEHRSNNGLPALLEWNRHYTTLNAVGRIEEILLLQSRMKPKQEEEPRSGRTNGRSQYRWNQRSRQGQQRNTVAAMDRVFSEMTLPVLW